MKVSILGCGWFGTALSKTLKDQGHTVKGSTTSTDKLNDSCTHLIKLETTTDSVFDLDFFDCALVVVANNVRMNDKIAYLARINFTIEFIKLFDIPKVIFISSTSVYGEPNQIVDESSAPHPETLSAKLLYQGEELFQKAIFDCIILRFAGLFGPGRDPGRFFAGKTGIHNGLAPVNLLHLDDAVGITMQLIAAGSNHKIINAVSPDHPTRMDFYTQAAKESVLELPVFIPEKTQWKIVNNIYLDYEYKHNLLS